VKPGVSIDCHTLSFVLSDVRLLCYWLEGLKEAIDTHVTSGRAPAQHVWFCAGPPMLVEGHCRWLVLAAEAWMHIQCRINHNYFEDCKPGCDVSSRCVNGQQRGKDLTVKLRYERTGHGRVSNVLLCILLAGSFAGHPQLPSCYARFQLRLELVS
jgi:hypothetical protein